MSDYYNSPPGWEGQKPESPPPRPEQPPQYPQYPQYPTNYYPPVPPVPPSPPNYNSWQNYYPPQPPTSQPPPYQPYYRDNDRRGMAIASMVLGIAAIVFCCVLWVSLVFGMLGIVLGCFSLKSSGKNMAIAGIACGSAGLVIFLLWLMLAMGIPIFSWNFWDYYY